jgi:hypothetical protein
LAGRTPAEAVGAFLAPLQQAIDCLTPTVLNVSGGYFASDQPHALVLGDGDPVRLAGEHDLALTVAQNYRVVEFEGPRGPWKVQTTAYFYELQRGDRELLGFHWHPRGASPHTSPHLHVGAAAEIGFAPLHRAHIPTGRIALEDVLRLAIEAFGVQPRRGDWDDVLTRTQAGYEAWRTWPAPRPPDA